MNISEYLENERRQLENLMNEILESEKPFLEFFAEYTARESRALSELLDQMKATGDDLDTTPTS